MPPGCVERKLRIMNKSDHECMVDANKYAWLHEFGGARATATATQDLHRDDPALPGRF